MAPKFTTQSAREAFDEICERAVLSEKAMDALARLGRELAEMQQATRWQPIETAPKDGSLVILAGGEMQRPIFALWTPRGYWAGDQRGPYEPVPYAAAFWMPAPPLPSEA